MHGVFFLLQALKGKLQEFGDKQKGVQESIRKHEKASKDADVENTKKDLAKELDESVKILQEVCAKFL